MKFPSLRVDRYMQYISTLAATLIIASIGMHLTWCSPTLPILFSEDSPLGAPITKDEGSWIASLLLLFGVVGCTFSRWVTEKFGRKKTLLWSGIPMTISWLLIPFAKSVFVIYLCRILGGLTDAVVITSAPLYVSEIADKDIRGSLVTAVMMLEIAGNLYIRIAGPFLSYAALAFSCSALPIFFMIVFFFMPESPYYLIKINDREGARKNLLRLLGSKDRTNVESKLDEIEYTVLYDMQNQGTLWELLSKKSYKKSIIIVTGAKSMHILSGIMAIGNYLQTIIEISNSSISPEMSSVFSGIIEFMSVILASYLIDKVGRKMLFILSSAGCAVTLFGEGLYFYLLDWNMDVSNLTWLPTICLVLFFLMHSVGLAVLPYVLLSEVFATNIKEVASSLFTAYTCGLSFLVVQFFQPISTEWGACVCFWLFTCACILGIIFGILCVPETKGKSFEEIQMMLNSNRRTLPQHNESDKET